MVLYSTTSFVAVVLSLLKFGRTTAVYCDVMTIFVLRFLHYSPSCISGSQVNMKVEHSAFHKHHLQLCTPGRMQQTSGSHNMNACSPRAVHKLPRIQQMSVASVH